MTKEPDATETTAAVGGSLLEAVVMPEKPIKECQQCRYKQTQNNEYPCSVCEFW